MSSFKIQARHKKTGELVDVWCIDGYFGGRNYGYIIHPAKDARAEGDTELTEEQFYSLYILEEPGAKQRAAAFPMIDAIQGERVSPAVAEAFRELERHNSELQRSIAQRDYKIDRMQRVIDSFQHLNTHKHDFSSLKQWVVIFQRNFREAAGDTK